MARARLVLIHKHLAYLQSSVHNVKCRLNLWLLTTLKIGLGSCFLSKAVYFKFPAKAGTVYSSLHFIKGNLYLMLVLLC